MGTPPKHEQLARRQQYRILIFIVLSRLTPSLRPENMTATFAQERYYVTGVGKERTVSTEGITKSSIRGGPSEYF